MYILGRLLLFASCFSQLSSQAYLLPRKARGGLTFDTSCAPYKSDFDKATAQARQLPKTGYLQAKDLSMPYWRYLFRDKDQDLVILVMKNVIRAINGAGAQIRIACETMSDCDIPETSGAFMYMFDDFHEDYINFCPRALTGPKAFPADQDYCE